MNQRWHNCTERGKKNKASKHVRLSRKQINYSNEFSETKIFEMSYLWCTSVCHCLCCFPTLLSLGYHTWALYCSFHHTDVSTSPCSNIYAWNLAPLVPAVSSSHFFEALFFSVAKYHLQLMATFCATSFKFRKIALRRNKKFGVDTPSSVKY